MRTIFKGKKISGILGILPETEYAFDDEVENFDEPVKQSMRLKKVMGFDKHRLAKPCSNTSDFCIFGLQYLLDRGMVKKEEIGAVIVVTVTPDYFIPHVSNIIHGVFQLNQDVICMDIAQGCSGYVMGLMQAFLLLDHLGDKKAVLFNADVLNRNADKKCRESYPLSGDAASVTIIENDRNAEDVYFILHTDGTNRNAIMIDGAWNQIPEGQKRGMVGTEIFNFAQREVPPLLDEIISYANIRKEDIDYYLFHQPNKFMLEKLSNKCELPREKVFMDIVGKYGNSSGATIPITITEHLNDTIVQEKKNCCLSGFGEGLTWCAMIIELGNLAFCELVSSNL